MTEIIPRMWNNADNTIIKPPPAKASGSSKPGRRNDGGSEG
jgi:hypothetical protein